MILVIVCIIIIVFIIILCLKNKNKNFQVINPKENNNSTFNNFLEKNKKHIRESPSSQDNFKDYVGVPLKYPIIILTMQG